MSKSAGGTIEEPGRHVAQKSGLNRSILDQGWGKFRRQLEYKQEWRGGHAAKENRLSQATFRCVECFLKAMPIGWPHKIFSVEAWDC